MGIKRKEVWQQHLQTPQSQPCAAFTVFWIVLPRLLRLFPCQKLVFLIVSPIWHPILIPTEDIIISAQLLLTILTTRSYNYRLFSTSRRCLCFFGKIPYCLCSTYFVKTSVFNWWLFQPLVAENGLSPRCLLQNMQLL